ncbi:MAG: UvrD-helicase domain-containing protein, partial [Campylobacterota bacterium]|nr:UvrD-helicase domain-containing protein [Campylobacterota bacterium]
MNKFTIQKSFAISAGAGSGKTYTLSRRYINAILGFDYFREDYKADKLYFEDLKPACVNQIVTITYTEAAALEMKARIFELVSKIINPNLSKEDDDYSSIQDANSNITKEQQKYVQQTLKQAFQDSSNSKISTIHSFCLDIIKSNSDIARIDTKLDIIKDDEKANELSKIIFEVLNDEGNKERVLDISKDISMFFINNLISKYVSNTKFRNDYDSFDIKSISLIDYKKMMFELYPLPDVKEDFFFVRDYILNENIEDGQKYIDFIDEYIKKVFNFEAQYWGVLSKEHNITIAFNRKPWTKHKGIKDNIDAIKELDGFVDIYSFIDIQKEDFFFEKIEKIKTLLHQIKLKYDYRLKDLSKIDFDTIILKTLELIPYATTDFKYIMVDEFQDTNATQFDIVKNSMNKDGTTNLFVVGDSKQSIYSFQGAEIEVFNNAINDTSILSSCEPMNINHRSDGVVLDRVNDIFKEVLKPNTKLKLIKPNYEAQPQDLKVFKKERENKGSFKYLITSQPYKEEISELDTIANFISELYNGTNSDYKHISKLIEKKEKAIAIVFDSSTKMVELKQKLKTKGITAKVSASDNFYHTKELNDIFNLLKAIDILSRKPKELNDTQNYYLVGAMRSNILRCDDNSIKQYLDTNTYPNKLIQYVDLFNTLPLSQAVKFIYDDSNLMGVYTHFEDVEQRVANLYKFITLCKDYENSDESNLYKFLSLIENSIYFSEAKEDEAFFKSDNTKSIEICSIHSTKGLAYPLVLLGNSDKGLYSQITSDALKHNNFSLNDKKKEIVGFKINNYTPLSHRVLKAIDKLKHLAEKKRLLYVALTRAEHDVVISAHLKQKKDGEISLKEDSYLHMMCEALGIDIDELYGQNENYCIQLSDSSSQDIKKEEIEYIKHTLKPISFESNLQVSATANSETTCSDNTAANLGTVTHKIIELYWNSFNQNQDTILDKMMIYELSQREAIILSMDSFYKSDIHKLLDSGVEHHFELEFNVDGKTGF